MVLGSGGREHALCWRITHEGHRAICAPGSQGIAQHALDDTAGIIELAKRESVDAVIVGPEHDPAGIAGLGGVAEALTRIASSKARFVSRGDDSGTHKKERALWQAAGVNAAAASGRWYRETGSGMGATLNTAVGMGAYTLTDRATWIAFRNKADFRILVEGDPRLFNQYGIILVDSRRHPTVKTALGQRFIDWVLSAEGQAAIGSYRRDGQALFFPNAAR